MSALAAIFDFSDHTLTTIGTWAEVAILLFMLYEYGVPRIRAWPMNTRSGDTSGMPLASGFWGNVWANRTLVVAIIGLAIVIWLQWGRSPVQGFTQDQVNEKLNVVLGPIKKELADAQKAREQAITGRDQARSELASALSRAQLANPSITTLPLAPAPAPEMLPITWYPPLLEAGNDANSIAGITVHGHCNKPTMLKSAGIVSDLTGARRQFLVIMSGPRTVDFIPVDQINELQAGADVELSAKFDQQLPVPDFLNVWGHTSVEIQYENGNFKETFDESYMKSQIMRLLPGAGIGPRPTRITQ